MEALYAGLGWGIVFVGFGVMVYLINKSERCECDEETKE